MEHRRSSSDDVQKSTMFRHETLSLEQNQFRLFRILDYKSGLLECSVDVCDLKDWTYKSAAARDGQFYQAVSYTWGAPLPLRKIVLNGKPFQIRENLWLFLESITRGLSTHASCHLWIDQLCTDQDNLLERNHQVRQMREIYSGAANVLVWLGPAENKSAQVMDRITRSMEMTEEQLAEQARWLWRSADIRAGNGDFGFSPDIRVGNGDFDFSPAILDGIETLISIEAILKRRYWSRLWVLQEIALARQRTIACGDRTVSWEAFQKFYRSFSSRSELFYNDTGEAEYLDTILNFPSAIPSRNIIELLQTFDQSDCEDARDRVYGLLSMSAQQDDIVIDYDKSPGDVYWTAWEHAERLRCSERQYYRMLRVGLDMGVTGREESCHGLALDNFCFNMCVHPTYIFDRFWRLYKESPSLRNLVRPAIAGKNNA